ncbi:MAG: ABC transporter ATP-binding protein [Candidatus Methanomethylophilus sp.]|nr:ABC transporter ATP-binding protein [Methanomethylophilus sp.]
MDLTINGPGLYCIIGPNGVGKSTLVKCLVRILNLTEGKILVNGQDLAKMDRKEISKTMAYVPVGGNDLFSMPVVDAVLIGRFTQQKWRTSDLDLKTVYRTLKLLGISSLAMHSYNELSAGQHQKVAIARGLVQGAPVLILDEPTANLDVRYQVYVAELLKELASKNEMTIVMISHDLNVAARYADQVILMGQPGIIRKIGTAPEVITAPLIEEIYGVQCEIIEDSFGLPHVILGSAVRIDE